MLKKKKRSYSHPLFRIEILPYLRLILLLASTSSKMVSDCLQTMSSAGGKELFSFFQASDLRQYRIKKAWSFQKKTRPMNRLPPGRYPPGGYWAADSVVAAELAAEVAAEDSLDKDVLISSWFTSTSSTTEEAAEEVEEAVELEEQPAKPNIIAAIKAALSILFIFILISPHESERIHSTSSSIGRRL
ncbi:hypothetical protein IM774_02015 [Erysipelotrichaceae bacterium RD49]|nr:hypothetical protein [Erysipelotrichaceae bacterium RD49]